MDDWFWFLLVTTLFASCWADGVLDRYAYHDCLAHRSPAECAVLKP